MGLISDSGARISYRVGFNIQRWRLTNRSKNNQNRTKFGLWGPLSKIDKWCNAAVQRSGATQWCDAMVHWSDVVE
eukprot:9430316-Karenia_brevis.AAC.1